MTFPVNAAENNKIDVPQVLLRRIFLRICGIRDVKYMNAHIQAKTLPMVLTSSDRALIELSDIGAARTFVNEAMNEEVSIARMLAFGDVVLLPGIGIGSE